MTDLSARNFVRRGNALVPADAAADDYLARIPHGREVLVVIRRPRNPAHNRKFRALCSRVAEATGIWRNGDELVDALKMELGHWEWQKDLQGRPRKALKSLSFAAMDQDKFNEFYEHAMAAIVCATGIDPEELRRELKEEEGKYEYHHTAGAGQDSPRS